MKLRMLNRDLWAGEEEIGEDGGTGGWCGILSMPPAYISRIPLNDGPIVYLGIARHHRLTHPS